MLSLHLMDCLSRKKLNHFLFFPIDLDSMGLGFLQESSAPVRQPSKGLRTDVEIYAYASGHSCSSVFDVSVEELSK